jgi:hypothetical protein
MRQQQYGRNMLIGEYLWIAYCQSLPPGVEPDRSMWRERKQVSSHIQVLKNFFQHHRCCKSHPSHPRSGSLQFLFPPFPVCFL